MNSTPGKSPQPLVLASAACSIRRGTPADAVSLAVFAADTFTDTYGRHNCPRNLQLYLDASFGRDQQAAELSNPQVRTLLAHVDGQLSAYAQVRHGPTPACVSSAAAVELHRFYVDRTWHGRGISQRLLAQVYAAALEFDGAEMLWLKVWEQNARAIAFYAKAGLTDVGTADFFVGKDCQRDRVLAIALDRHPPEPVADIARDIEDRS